MILRYDCRLSRHLYTKAPSKSSTPYPSRLELDTVNLPLRTEFPVFWVFLGIPKNSKKFPSMQMSSDFKSLELLGISGKGRLQFCENLEFLGILSYKLPKKGAILGNFWELNLRRFKYPEVQINSKKFSLPWMWGF